MNRETQQKRIRTKGESFRNFGIALRDGTITDVGNTLNKVFIPSMYQFKQPFIVTEF